MNYQSLIAIDCLLEGTVTAHTEIIDDGYGTIGGWDVGVLVGRIAMGSIYAQRVISVVEVNQEAEDATTSRAYSASCGLLYGALAKNSMSGEYWPMNSNPTVKKFFYVDLFNSTSGEITPATGATAVSITKLQGIAPSVQLIPKTGATEEDFDFSIVEEAPKKNPEDLEEPIVYMRDPENPNEYKYIHKGVWTCDYEGNDLPHLTDMGKATKGAPSGSNTSGNGDNRELVPERPATCTTAGMREHYYGDGKYTDAAGNELSLSELTIPAGHTYGELVAASDTMKAYYRCSVCGQYFDENKNEVKKSDLKIETAKKGCGSVIVGAPLIAVAIFGSALLMKKKEDESK